MDLKKLALAIAAACHLIPVGNASAVDLSKITFNGYIDMEYVESDNNPDLPNPGQQNGAFHQHHLSFLLDVPVNDRVSVYTHLEFDHGVNTGVKNGGDIIVENAFIRYLMSDTFQFRFGKSLTPFGYYNEIHDATPAFTSVFVPHTIYRVDERGGRAMFPKWNTGVSMLGSFNIKASVLDYVIYAGNGENNTSATTPTNEAEADDNRNKAFGARISFQPTEVIQIGASYFTGEKATGITEIINTPHTTYGVLFTANVYRLNFLAEHAVSDLNGRSDVGTYGQVSYFLSRRFTPYYRFELTDPNNNVADDTWAEHIAGLNIKPAENLIFKAEYSANSRGEHFTPTVTYRNYQELRLAVTVYF